MSPLKNNSVKEIEEAIAGAVLALTGQAVFVEIGSLEFAASSDLTKISLSVRKDLGPDPFRFPGAS